MIALHERPLLTHTAATAILVVTCGLTGIVIAVKPEMGAAAVLAASVGALFFLGLSPTKVFLTSLVILLTAYAFFEKGIAYLGLAPIYIGEVVLALAVTQIFVAVWKVRLQTLHWLLLLFMLYGLVRTLPFIGVYGVDALRDSVIWGYALFAFAVSFTVERSHVEWVHRFINKWLPWILVAGALAQVVQLTIGPSLPMVPGADVPFLFVRGGEAAVHLAGMSAFLLLGLYVSRTDSATASPNTRRGEIAMYALVVLGLLLLSTISRAAFLTIGVGLFAAFLFRPSVRILQFAAAGALVIPLLLVFKPHIQFGEREFSAEQITQNVTSIFSPQEGSQLEGTRNFREDWWHSIIRYTFHGPHFWGGKGFGINLADDDGFQVNADGSLRSPHNGHINILARMGVPGFALWLTILGTFVITMLRARQLFLRHGDTLLAGMCAWVLVYWLAAVVNTSFDVYLEGPQGGIWFWCLMGLGISLSMLAGKSRVASPALSPVVEQPQVRLAPI